MSSLRFTRSKEISRRRRALTELSVGVVEERVRTTLVFVQWQQKSTMATSQCLTRILEADVGSNREVVETVRFRRNSSSSFHWIRYWHRGRCFVFGLTRAVFVQVSDTLFETAVVCVRGSFFETAVLSSHIKPQFFATIYTVRHVQTA